MGPTLLHDFEAKVASDPGFPVVERGDELWTRRDLLELVDALDRHLPPLPQGSLVGLRARNGPIFLGCLLLMRRRGWTTLLVDGETRDRQLAATMRDFCLDGAVDAVDPCARAARAAETTRWHESKRDALGWSSALREAPPAFVKLTSGSTGSPNAVVVSEAQALADETALTATMSLAQERILTTIPMAHSYGFSSVALSALRRDCTVVLPESSNPLSAIRCLRQREITFLPSVPAWLKALADLPAAPERLGGTRTVISAGAPLPPDVASAFRDRFGTPIHTFYGASECGGICFDRDGTASLEGHLGHPVDGVEIELVSGEGDAASDEPEADVGRVCVRSAAVAMGRLLPATPADRSEPTRTVVVDASLGNGRFVSMDLGRLEPSGLRILGRADDLLNLRGRKVHPREIEAVLDSHPDVIESYVFQTDEAGLGVLVAAVVGTEAATRRELLGWARSHLPDYKVPRAFVHLPELARNARGKLDRRRLENEAIHQLRRSRGSEE